MNVERLAWVIAVLQILVLPIESVFAQQEFVPQGMAECAADIGLHCSRVQRGGGRIVKCLQEVPTLSATCKATVLPSDGAAGDLSIAVTISGIKSKSGFLFVTLSDDPKTFPSGRRMVIKAADVGSVTVTFKHLKPGTYAVTAFHDENDNGKFDIGFTGGEGFAARSNATMPPAFDGNAVKVMRDSKLTISMVYF